MCQCWVSVPTMGGAFSIKGHGMNCTTTCGSSIASKCIATAHTMDVCGLMRAVLGCHSPSRSSTQWLPKYDALLSGTPIVVAAGRTRPGRRHSAALTAAVATRTRRSTRAVSGVPYASPFAPRLDLPWCAVPKTYVHVDAPCSAAVRPGLPPHYSIKRQA